MKKVKTYLQTLFTKTVQGKLDLSDLALPPFEKWVTVTAVFLAGFVMAAAVSWGVAYSLMPNSKGVHADDSGAASISNSVRMPETPVLEDFNPIIKRNLFNSEAGDAEVVELDSCEPQESTLPLTLRGVIFGGSADSSLVLIESATTKEIDSFILGETVPGGVRISDITRERVFFLKNGCPQYLEVEKPELPQRRVADPSRRTQLSVAQPIGNANDYSEEGFERSGSNINVTRQWIDRAVTLDFAKTLQDAKASPHMVGGQVKGFVLTQIRPDSVYEKMGLENGDVVRSINGIELNDAARAIQTLNAMRNETQLDVVFERQGSVMNRKIQVK